MVLATSVFVGPASAQAQQTYPNRPIRFVVPQTAGGSTDIAVRLLGQKLFEGAGQQIVVDNRAGAGGIVGAEIVAKASPDGYTMVAASQTQCVLPSLHKHLPYHIVRDFAPVSMLISYPFALAVHPALPVKSVKELIALAKAKPGQINYASSGGGSAAHLNAELFKNLSGINIVHVPYKGVAPAVTGLIAGEASLGFYSVSATLPHLKAGRLRALATTGATRSPSLPDLPSISEAGVPGYEAVGWSGVLVPAGVPRPIISKLHGEFRRVLQLAEVKGRFALLDFEPVGNNPDEFARIIKDEVLKWAKIVKAAGAKVD